MKRFLLAVFVILAPAFKLFAGGSRTDSTYHWRLSTNICDWAMLATINGEAEYCLTEHTSLLAGIKYNPFTYCRGTENQTCFRQATPYLGSRYWFSDTGRGWYAGGKILASVYNISSSLFGCYYEGELVGAGLNAGYSWRLSLHRHLSFGCGFLAAAHKTTRFAGAVCGRILDSRKGFILLPDLSLTIGFSL